MRKMLTTIAALTGLALAGPALAASGNFDIGWNTCAPTTTNLAPIAEGTASVPLFATVIGGDVPHKAYQFQIIYGNAGSRTYPDAWDFTAAGCQTSSQIALEHLAPAKTCPSFQGLLASQQIKDVSRVPGTLPYETTFMRITLQNAYPAGNSTDINPAIRYFLGRIVFNHTFSVNAPTTPAVDCGELDTPMCFATISADYVTLDGQTIPFGLAGNRGVTVDADAGCPQSPVKNSTWGAIKSQYRL
jgi:hypothetical protein